MIRLTVNDLVLTQTLSADNHGLISVIAYLKLKLLKLKLNDICHNKAINTQTIQFSKGLNYSHTHHSISVYKPNKPELPAGLEQHCV